MKEEDFWPEATRSTYKHPEVKIKPGSKRPENAREMTEEDFMPTASRQPYKHPEVKIKKSDDTSKA